MSRQPDRPRPGGQKTDEAFLSRWSRLKVDESTSKTAVTPADEAVGPENAIENRQPTEEEILASLPDIESLEEASDFTPFLRHGVPELLKRQALRRLWRINPVFAEIDGLAEYAEDYTDAASVLTEVKTAYKVGRGYLDREAEAEEDAALQSEAAHESEPQPTQEIEPEGDPSAEPDGTLQAAEAPDPQQIFPQTENAVDLEPETASVPDVTKGRAAARRWGLPGS